MASLVSYLLSTRRALLMKWRQGKQKWIKVHNFSSSFVMSSYSVTEIAAVVKAPVAGRDHPQGFCEESSNSADMDSLQKKIKNKITIRMPVHLFFFFQMAGAKTPSGVIRIRTSDKTVVNTEGSNCREIISNWTKNESLP